MEFMFIPLKTTTIVIRTAEQITPFPKDIADFVAILLIESTPLERELLQKGVLSQSGGEEESEGEIGEESSVLEDGKIALTKDWASGRDESFTRTVEAKRPMS